MSLQHRANPILVSVPSLPARGAGVAQSGAGSGTGKSRGMSRCCFTQALPAMLLSSCFSVWLSICKTQSDSFHALPCILILPSSGQDFYQAPAAACVELPSLKEPVQLNLVKSAPKLHMLLEWEIFFHPAFALVLLDNFISKFVLLLFNSLLLQQNIPLPQSPPGAQ